MSKKKKVVFHSNYSRVFTGFGKNAKNILKYLEETGKYDIVEFSNGVAWGHEELKTLPWKAIGSYPNDQPTINHISQDPVAAKAAGYGAYRIDKMIEEERPDVYIGSEDIWAFDGYYGKKWWSKINTMIWTTLDSLPILPSADYAAKKTNNFFVWSSFAENDMRSRGINNVQTLHGSIDTSKFYRIKEKRRDELRRRHNLADHFVIGFVFRNQLRKSIPKLIKGFKIFKEQNPKVKAKLLLHTHWPECWDINRLIKDNGVDPNDVVTTYFCKNCKQYEVKSYSGQDIDCPLCGAKRSQDTTNINHGVSESQLNEVYNLMDVYCHPFTSGGQEIPIQEAKLTELITLVTNYSCGEDSCKEGSGGIPLSWSEYWEHGTQFIKASTCENSIAYNLKKVLNMSPEKRRSLEKEARKYVLENYSIEVIGKQLEEIIDAMPEVQWDFNMEDELRDPNYVPQQAQNNVEFLIDIYANVLRMEMTEQCDGVQYWLNELNSQKIDRNGVLRYFHNVAIEENQKIQNKPIDLADLLDDDEGRRLLFIMPRSIGDIYISTSLFADLKKNYPDYNLYISTLPEYFEILDGNPYVHRVIPYSREMDNPYWLEGQGKHKGYFDIALHPYFGTQVNHDYHHNGKDVISFDIRS